MLGSVKAVNDRGFGFIVPTGIAPDGDNRDVFFHASDLVDELEFDERLTGMRVEYDVEPQQDRGPRARRVRAAR